MSVEIDVRGLPRPQGSMRLHQLANGHTAARYPPAVYEWRAKVQQAAADQSGVIQFLGPVVLELGFDLPRPLGHFGTGRNAGAVKASAPAWPAVMPDLDKLVRCVCDALTDAGVWRDDAQVVVLRTAKRYVCPPDVPGVLINIRGL